MELLSSLSKETSNNYDVLIKLPAHILIAQYNALKKIFKDEREAQKAAEEEAKSGRTSMSMPSFSMPSMPSMPRFN